MNPELSARVAAARQHPPLDDLPFADWRPMAEQVDDADSFEDLPEKLRRLVEEAEGNAGEAVTAAAVRMADIPPVPHHLTDAYLATAANRLQGAGDLLWEAARDQLREGVAAGESHRRLATRIRKATGLALPRARVIARTEARDALLAGSLNQVRATGLTGTKTWVSVRRSPRTRPEHKHAHGQTVDLRGFFEVGGWPMDRPHDDTAPAEITVNCFPAGTLVQASGVLRGYRRWYEGILVKLTLASGHELAGTPNHPVLTPRGWLPLHLLDEGDDVICGSFGQEPTAGDGYVDDVPTPIEQVVSALAQVGSLQRVPGRDEDFHGDGRGDREIEVVRADGQLMGGKQATDSEPVPEQHLPDADLTERRLLAEGFTSQLLRARGLPSAGSVSSQGQEAPVFGARPGHAKAHSFASAPRSDSSSDQTVTNDAAVDSQGAGQSQLGLAVAVSLDKVLHVKRQAFADHVYNLQTSTEWYIANTILSRNCRCGLRYSLDTADVLLGPEVVESEPGENNRTTLQRAPADDRLLRQVWAGGMVRAGVTVEQLAEVLADLGLTAAADETFHLPGKHDQHTHGHSKVDISADLARTLPAKEAGRVSLLNDLFHDQYGHGFSGVVKLDDRHHKNGVIAGIDNADRLHVDKKRLWDGFLKKREAEGWLAPGTGHVEGTITHEYGHRLFHSDQAGGPERTTRRQALQAGQRAAVAKGAPGNLAVSSYGRNQGGVEAEAELFSHYHWGGDQREPWVQAWGQTVHEELGYDPTPMSELYG